MDGEALQHGQEEADEGAEEPVLDQEVGQSDGQAEDALDEVGQGQVAHQEERLVVVEAASDDDEEHGGVAGHPDHPDGGVEEDEERVDVVEGVADVGLGEVHPPGLVGRLHP